MNLKKIKDVSKQIKVPIMRPNLLSLEEAVKASYPNISDEAISAVFESLFVEGYGEINYGINVDSHIGQDIVDLTNPKGIEFVDITYDEKGVEYIHNSLNLNKYIVIEYNTYDGVHAAETIYEYATLKEALGKMSWGNLPDKQSFVEDARKDVIYKNSKGKWKIKGKKKDWPAEYDSEAAAKKALKAYFANKKPKE